MRMVDTVGYAPNNMGEFIMQFGMLLAATQSHRVVGGKIMAFNDFIMIILKIITRGSY